MWQTESTCNPTRTFTPDSVTTYDYDYDNRLTTVNLPTNSDTVEYTYDATGRRLTKEFTYHNGANTDVTTYKYHYIGSQITEIEIDAIRNPGATQSVLRNEEVKIHLGANSQPISYEWVKHVGETTTQATYYYHYDIHGNVLKITDSSENTKITYTYDVLGKILTESNPDSVLNFFTFRGASQTIWEPETGLYYSGGYYRPDTGTALQGTGAPVLTNPASGAMLNAIALATAANAQLAVQAAVAASSAGSGGSFAPPPGPSNGLSRAGNHRPPPDPDPSADFTQAYCIAPKEESVEERYKIVDGGQNDLLKLPKDDGYKVGKPKQDEKKPLTDAEYQKLTGHPRLPSPVEEPVDCLSGIKGYRSTSDSKADENDVINDTNKADDNKQYYWVIRDKNGKITACHKRSNDQIYIFNTNSDGTRKANPKNLYGDENQIDTLVASWKNICGSLKPQKANKNKPYSTIKSYTQKTDKNGNISYVESQGVKIGIQIDDNGTWLGIFADGSGVKIKQGTAKDFDCYFGPTDGGYDIVGYRKGSFTSTMISEKGKYPYRQYLYAIISYTGTDRLNETIKTGMDYPGNKPLYWNDNSRKWEIGKLKDW